MVVGKEISRPMPLVTLCVAMQDSGGMAPGNGYTTVWSLNGTETDDRHGTETDDQHGTNIGDRHGTETDDQHGTETMSGEVNFTASQNAISSEGTASAHSTPSTDVQHTIETTPTTPTPISTPDTPEDVDHAHLPPGSDVINNDCDSEEPVIPEQELPTSLPVDISDSVDISTGGDGGAEDASTVGDYSSPVVDSGSPVVDSGSSVVDYSGTVVDDPELEEEVERSIPNGSYDNTEHHLHSGVDGEQLGGHQDGGADEEHSITPPLTADDDPRDNEMVGTTGSEGRDVEDPEPVADQRGPHDDQHSPEGTNHVPKTHQDHIVEDDITELPTADNSDSDIGDYGDDGDIGDDIGDDGDDKMVGGPDSERTLEVQETGREVEEDGIVPADVVNDRGYPTNDRGYPTNENSDLVMEGNSSDCGQQELENGRSHDVHNLDNGGSHDSGGGSHDPDGGSHDPHSEDSENMTSLTSDGMTNGSGAGMLTGQQKEKSVFLRLSNRIRDLEENMSLFSSYLDEISTG